MPIWARWFKDRLVLGHGTWSCGRSNLSSLHPILTSQVPWRRASAASGTGRRGRDGRERGLHRAQVRCRPGAGADAGEVATRWRQGWGREGKEAAKRCPGHNAHHHGHLGTCLCMVSMIPFVHMYISGNRQVGVSQSPLLPYRLNPCPCPCNRWPWTLRSRPRIC